MRLQILKMMLLYADPDPENDVAIFGFETASLHSNHEAI